MELELGSTQHYVTILFYIVKLRHRPYNRYFKRTLRRKVREQNKKEGYCSYVMFKISCGLSVTLKCDFNPCS